LCLYEQPIFGDEQPIFGDEQPFSVTDGRIYARKGKKVKKWGEAMLSFNIS